MQGPKQWAYVCDGAFSRWRSAWFGTRRCRAHRRGCVWHGRLLRRAAPSMPLCAAAAAAPPPWFNQRNPGNMIALVNKPLQAT
jgi:hypothetical protein